MKRTTVGLLLGVLALLGAGTGVAVHSLPHATENAEVALVSSTQTARAHDMDVVAQHEAEEAARQAAEAQAAQAAAAEAARQEQVRAAAATRRASRSKPAPEIGNGHCGGDLPPCRVMGCESGGNLRSVGHSRYGYVRGKWQILDSTWNGYGGYANAAEAPEDVQDAKAKELWAGGRGAGQWQCK